MAGRLQLDELVHQELVKSYHKYSTGGDHGGLSRSTSTTTYDTSTIGTTRGNATQTGAFRRGGGKRRRKGFGGSTNSSGGIGKDDIASIPPTNSLAQTSPSGHPPRQLFLSRSLRTSGRLSHSSRNGSAGLRKRATRANSSSPWLTLDAPPGSQFAVEASSSASTELNGDGMRSIVITNELGFPEESTNPGIPNYDDAVVGARRILDIHQISSRLHRSFQWEGQSDSHSLDFSSYYIVPLILLLGFLIACIWLFCACCYYTMKKIKFSSFCPGRNKSKKGKNNCESNNGHGGDDKKEMLAQELLELKRQERLAFLQAECANLEQQLTGLRAQQMEKSTTLTSRASDSDLEYLGIGSESPPLKRNSISLQDIPQSVIRIRREKELRQIKEEIECLRHIAQQEKEKAAAAEKALKGVLLTHDFELPRSKPSSPSDTKVVEPLSQHISHLKAQRKLNEIRSELEDLAIQLLHPDELKAKRSSLQELPRTAINIQREQRVISMTNEIQKQKHKLQKRNVIETVLEKTTYSKSPSKKKSTKNPDGGDKKAGGKSFTSINESPSTQDAAAKYSDPEFVHRASIKRQREQELNRVRVELKDLAYKLNLNPMNYISEDRVRLVPSQSMQSTSSGQSSQSPKKGSKTQSSASGLNHV